MNQVNFDNWKAHPHYLSELMTPAKGKSNREKYDEANNAFDIKWAKYEEIENKTTKTAQELLDQINRLSKEIDRLEPIKDFPHLSVGCISRLRKVWVAETTGRKHHIESKYLEKGLLVEEDCITAYSLFTGDFHKKNKVRKENEYLDGEWDFTTNEGCTIVDTKASWDLNTFYDAFFKPLDSGYEWQLQGYMYLDEKDSAKLVYVLINTPEHLIQAEERKAMYQMFGSEGNMAMAPKEALDAYKEECEHIRSVHIFDDIPLEKKIKIFDVKRDEKMIAQIGPKVEACRYYLNNIEKISNYDIDD